MNEPARREVDVAILGGGLAGLSLALQLRRRFSDLKIMVIERRRHPVPEAAHKVGESTVEIAAFYFDEVLGLAGHLNERQLPKFGFRFFFSEKCRHIEEALEIGVSTALPTPTYQIDRGIFENCLGSEAHARGIDFTDGTVVRGIALGTDDVPHRVTCENGDGNLEVRARWLIDASGRASLLKRELALAEGNDHDVNSAWFRIEARIDVNEWSENQRWKQLCTPPDRWRSTNHLVGEGYWVWLIPLGSGSHSVGIVADGRIHDSARINSFRRALEWLREFQPLLAADVESKQSKLQDFLFIKHFSHNCRKVFSGDRWALTGESGVFPDPFYSPGSDFIAIANTYITELIAHDRAGQPVSAYSRVYEQLFMSFFESTMSLYRDQYRIFGDTDVLPVKVIWDYTYYWGVLCQIVFQNRLADIRTLADLREEMQASKDLNAAMQDLFRSWSAASPRRCRSGMLDQSRLPWFVELNRGLMDRLDDAAFRSRIRAGLALMRKLAREILLVAHSRAPEVDLAHIETMLPASVGDENRQLLGEFAN